MSTITAAIRNGVISIAADSQLTTNERKETAEHVINHHKIFRVGENLLGLSGPASAELAMKSYFSALPQQPQFGSIAEIYKVWNDLHRALKDNFFLLPYDEATDCYESTRMDALIANATGLYFVEARRSVQQFSRYFAIGGGEDYALGAMFVAYQDESKSAEQIARLGVEAGAQWHTGTGGPIESHTVNLAIHNLA